MELLKGAPVAKALTEEAFRRASVLERVPKLAIVRIGENAADISYESAAVRRMTKSGILCETVTFPSDVSNECFLNSMREINADPSVDGILVLYPLPDEIDGEALELIISPEKDVDGITVLNRSRLLQGKSVFTPCTAEAVIHLLSFYGIGIAGKNTVVIGRSLVVGKPVALNLLNRDATVTVCHSKTVDLEAIASQADILVTAIGKARMIDEKYVKQGAVVIDIGTDEMEDGTLAGDCEFESVSKKASFLTPVPGGVGAVTTSVLALHTVEAAEKRQGK